mmetsp:Transcript_19397/g.41315  ORF Transcript_19397/g.41315 Transcript_19397/m.41315 type:complete len:389 (+) Transcript_19397:7-1173(+)
MWTCGRAWSDKEWPRPRETEVSREHRAELGGLVLGRVRLAEGLENARDLQLHIAAPVAQVTQELEHGGLIDAGARHAAVEESKRLQQRLLGVLDAPDPDPLDGAHPELSDDLRAVQVEVRVYQRNEDVLLDLLKDVKPLIGLLFLEDLREAREQHLHVLQLEVVEGRSLQLHGECLRHIEVWPSEAEALLLVHAAAVAHHVREPAHGPVGVGLGRSQETLPQRRRLLQEHCDIHRQKRRILGKEVHQRRESHLQHVLRAANHEEPTDHGQEALGCRLAILLIGRQLPDLAAGAALLASLFDGLLLAIRQRDLAKQVSGELEQLCLHLPPFIVGEGREGGDQSHDAAVLGRAGGDRGEDRDPSHADPRLRALHGDKGIVDVQIEEVLVQ